MNEREIDRALQNVFQAALVLRRDDEEALWTRLEAHIDQERIAWMAFATVMTRLNTRLQPVIDCMYWPARLRTYLS